MHCGSIESSDRNWASGMAGAQPELRAGNDNRQNAILDILEAIDRSKDNADAVFDVILKYATELCDAPFANLNLLDPSGQFLDFVREHGDSHLHFKPGWRWNIDTPLAICRAVREKSIIHIKDITDTDEYRAGEPTRKTIADDEGIRTFLAVPLISNGRAIGSIGLFRREVAPFSSQDIDLLGTFAQQAVLAIKNVRQSQDLRKKLEREHASAEILEVVSQSRDDERPVFETILKNAARLCDASLGFVFTVNDERTHYEAVAQIGAFSGFLDTDAVVKSPMDDQLIVSRAINQRTVLQVEDLKDDDLYREGNPIRVQTVDIGGVRTLLAVPLVHDNQGIGAIVLYRREVSSFSDDLIALVESFASQAVIAIENVRQYRALADRTAEVEALNSSLETRVADQVEEIERMGRLKRFLPFAVAEAVVTTGDESMLSSHRALIATLFCDMRGFTAFCESAEPEETIEVLQTYHQEMSDLIGQYGGGVDQRAGDGIMVIFNDPIKVDDPAGDAVRLALAMRRKMRELCVQWKKLGHRLGFGIGISLGYATVGMVGSSGRFDYTASGTTVNTAARLCDIAEHDEILISPRAWAAVEGEVEAESRGEIEMKGIRESVEVFSILTD